MAFESRNQFFGPGKAVVSGPILAIDPFSFLQSFFVTYLWGQDRLYTHGKNKYLAKLYPRRLDGQGDVHLFHVRIDVIGSMIASMIGELRPPIQMSEAFRATGCLR